MQQDNFEFAQLNYPATNQILRNNCKLLQMETLLGGDPRRGTPGPRKPQLENSTLTFIFDILNMIGITLFS